LRQLASQAATLSRIPVVGGKTDSQKQRKIRKLEEQLEKKAHLNTETNTQTGRNPPFKMVTRNMIAPGTRDAPSFSSKNPQDLLRFVRQMEDLWKAAEVTDDEQKKESIGKYADQNSEEEWKGLDTYDAGTWDAFKEELIANYPEAAAAERGTPARIRQLCDETKGIRLGDLAALYAFRRSFIAEAKKLTKPPAAMANRELVELFIGSLSESLAAAVLQYLGSNRSEGSVSSPANAKDKQPEDSTVGRKQTPRRPEDKYDLEDVCKAAIYVSESSQGMFHLMNRPLPEHISERKILMLNQPVSETNKFTQKLEEMENIQAQERDKLDIANKNMDTRFNELEGMMKTLLAQAQGNGNTGLRREMVPQYDPKNGVKLGVPGTIPKWGGGGASTRTSGSCFYCGSREHFVGPECDEMQEDVKNGLVKMNAEGKIRLSDGSYIPNMPNTTTIRERVEKHYAKKLNQFYCGNEDEEHAPNIVVPKAPIQFTNIVEDPSRRKARLEHELDLKEREETLELKQLKLEREEKKRLEQSGKTTRAAHVLDMLEQLTEEDIAAVKASKAGFQ
jgi:hypothetical protein